MIHENNDVISLLQHGRLLSTSIKLLHLYFSVFWPHNFFTAFNFFRFLIFSFTLFFFCYFLHTLEKHEPINKSDFFFFYRYFHYKVLHDSPTLFFIKNILCWVFLKFLSFSAYCKTHFLNLFYFLFFSFLFLFLSSPFCRFHDRYCFEDEPSAILPPPPPANMAAGL